MLDINNDRDQFEAVADPTILAGQYTNASLERVIKIALSCIEEDTKKRPQIAQVIRGLHKAQLDNERNKMVDCVTFLIIGLIFYILRYYIFGA